MWRNFNKRYFNHLKGEEQRVFLFSIQRRQFCRNGLQLYLVCEINK
jgi:hypothetical protein